VRRTRNGRDTRVVTDRLYTSSRAMRTRPHPGQIQWPTPAHTDWGPHAESHAITGNEISAITIGSNSQVLQSPSPGPATILLRNRATSAACTFGSTHRATAGARPTHPITVTPPDATYDHRHRLRPLTIRPRPPCPRRHRLVPAKPPTQRPHRRNLVLANHSQKRRPRRARRPEVL
jgi:hypothetical protein